MDDSFVKCRRRLIATVRQMVEESGHIENFDAEAWVDHWLGEPLPALGGVPREYLLAECDCDRIVWLLLRAQAGTFS
jgi:hypothetical protein